MKKDVYIGFVDDSQDQGQTTSKSKRRKESSSSSLKRKHGRQQMAPPLQERPNEKEPAIQLETTQPLPERPNKQERVVPQKNTKTCQETTQTVIPPSGATSTATTTTAIYMATNRKRQQQQQQQQSTNNQKKKKKKQHNNKNNHMEIKIELKGGYHQYNTIDDNNNDRCWITQVLELVEDMDMVPQVSFSSFNMNYLQRVRTLRPQQHEQTPFHVYRTGALFNDIDPYHNDDYQQQQQQQILHPVIAQAKAVGANEIHLRYDTCTVPLIREIHKHGLNTMAWFRGPVGMNHDVTYTYYDVGNEEDETVYDMVWKTGVQQMCINRPDVLIRLKEKRRKKTQKTNQPKNEKSKK
mmetsp:Transcript_3397/g.6199  ORF Transcript_3397/g.6199 Transcript_3397/m.6199 type:complete len:352 (+) Transcript_3397:846-1901(+)